MSEVPIEETRYQELAAPPEDLGPVIDNIVESGFVASSVPGVNEMAAVEVADFGARGVLLEEFAKSPDDENIWQRAYTWVRGEGDEAMPGQEDTAAADIPAEALIAYAELVRNTDPSERYKLTVATAPNGQNWFDVLRTFSSLHLERAKREVLLKICSSGYRFGRALDMGTGTGKSMDILDSIAERVVGLDRNAAMLAEAAKYKAPDTELVQASAEAPPFAAGSFDLITSSGLDCALDKTSAECFYSELARLLSPNGIYIDSYYRTNEEGYAGRELEDIQRTSKAMLADMIVDSVSGKLKITERLTFEEEMELVKQTGLKTVLLEIADQGLGDGTVALIRCIGRPEVFGDQGSEA